MRALVLLVVGVGVLGCSGRPAAAPLSGPHSAAMRDSVEQFLNEFAAHVSAPPVGTKARAALSGFYSADVVMSTDLAPVDPMLIRTLDSLVPADEVVTVLPWIKSTRFVWEALTITPLAPGVAMFSAKYAEQVTDTTGTVTTLPGVQQGVVRHGPQGWRIAAIQSAHPPATHEKQAALSARMTPAK